MEVIVSRAFSQYAPRSPRRLNIRVCSLVLTRDCWIFPPRRWYELRPFVTTGAVRVKLQEPAQAHSAREGEDSSSQPASEVSQNVTPEEKNHFDRIERESKENQRRSPWMREGSEKPPVARMRSAGAMTKGKLLTTPSRMLKLILPLTTRDANKDRKDVEPLALLIHPQQPLSYLERLIQSELPLVEDEDKRRIPNVIFRAEDSTEEDINSGRTAVEELAEDQSEEKDTENKEKRDIDGKKEQTGMIRSSSEEARQPDAKQKSKPDTPEDPDHPNFVRWSPSTDIGDFIRDAARAKEFSIQIEDAPPIYIGVPSFNDRTYYLRTRLRKTSRRILQLADIKKECDHLAQRSARRVAQGGFMGLIGWWGLVYYLTFRTSLGWDVMEPVTYLVGLSGLMGGYLWFLYHNREASYRSAMNFTVSRRQNALYQQKGFNLQHWEMLVEEANRLRREIKMVADEYDVEWDETRDEQDEKVTEALREGRKKEGKKDKEDEKEEKENKDDE